MWRRQQLPVAGIGLLPDLEELEVPFQRHLCGLDGMTQHAPAGRAGMACCTSRA